MLHQRRCTDAYEPRIPSPVEMDPEFRKYLDYPVVTRPRKPDVIKSSGKRIKKRRVA